MSEAAPEAPAAPRRENVLTHKLGPLPTWVWVAIAGGAFLVWRWYSSAKAGNQQQQQDTSSTGTDASQVPQFVNQTYVSTTAPAAQDNTTATAPTNPSPVGWPGTEPKPTTTLPGWHYPAPTGLKVTAKSGKGVHIAWNAVTGPSGQHPNNYLVATYESKGKMVNEHGTISGNTNTAEFGPGGRGLHKGTYHTNVWAQGGPVAPPHATVQYTLRG